jgi:hypothetical protein
MLVVNFIYSACISSFMPNETIDNRSRVALSDDLKAVMDAEALLRRISLKKLLEEWINANCSDKAFDIAGIKRTIPIYNMVVPKQSIKDMDVELKVGVVQPHTRPYAPPQIEEIVLTPQRGIACRSYQENEGIIDEIELMKSVNCSRTIYEDEASQILILHWHHAGIKGPEIAKRLNRSRSAVNKFIAAHRDGGLSSP